MRIIRLGFIGSGPIASLHAAAFSDIDNVELSICASRSLDKATAFARQHGFASAMTIDAFLNKPEVDALVVVVPAVHMSAIAIRAAATGLPLLMEKPIGMSLEETEKATATINVPNMVGLNRRFYKVIQEAKKIVNDSGGLRFIEVHMPEDIRALVDKYDIETRAAWHFGNSIHLIDLFRFFGGEPCRITTQNSVKNWWNRSYCGVIGFESQARGVFNAQWYAPGPWRVTLYADDVSITLAPIEQGLVLRAPGRQKTTLGGDGADEGFKPGFRPQAAAFISLVRTGRLSAGAADLMDYLKSARLVHALTAQNNLNISAGGHA